MFRGLICRAAGLLAIGCFFMSDLPAQTSPESSAWDAPPLESSISIRKGPAGEVISFERLLADLASAEVVFLGESHTDETTHRVELAIYEGLLELKDSQVVLGMEMFERDVQPHLDKYLAGETSEATFLAHSRPWSLYQEAYRPLVELAKASGSPVVASNFPAPLRKLIYGKDAEGIASLSDDQRKSIPKEFFANTDAYWRRTDNVTRSHQAFMPADAKSPEKRLYSTQSLWDNAMGEACAIALDDYPEHLVLHVNGGFHSAYGDGTVHQFQLRKPDARVKTVAIVTNINPQTISVGKVSSADYLIIAESRASNLHEGERSVQMGRSLKYRFHLPESATNESPTPLLVWLGEDGLTAKESMALCKERFGDAAAIVVISPPYKAIGEDLAEGGRWYWPETFASDTGLLVAGIERIGSYLRRHYPIDARPACVVGEGSGATVAAVVAIHTQRLPLNVLAFSPKQYAKIRDLALLLPEHYVDNPLPKRSLQIIGNAALKEWWQSELEQYNQVGVTSQFELTITDPWQQEQQTTNAIRSTLDLAELPAASAVQQQFLLLESPSPRAKHWGRLQARSISQRDGIPTVAVSQLLKSNEAIEISTAITPESVSAEGILPRCPGSFGGTTIIVLPKETALEEIAKWLAIESEDPLAAASRFYRVRIATGSGDRTLPKILEKLLTKNRKNILIAPASFYADLAWLRELRDNVRQFEDPMTLHWLPGLGGRPGVLGE